MTPEEEARAVIDSKLRAAGYIIQDKKDYNPRAALGVIVREWETSSGPVDYLILIDGNPVGVIEAKRESEGKNLTTVAEQSKRYAESDLHHFKNKSDIRFAYEATNIKIHFCDYHDISYRSREIFSFHKPEELKRLLDEKDKGIDTLRNRLKSFPTFDSAGFRDCQTRAIVNLEKSFGDNHPRALVQMATGAGKTYTAITSIYRLLKFAKAKRILFLVDTRNLGIQAEAEFMQYKPNDDTHRFTELYNVTRLNNSYISPHTHVCISTIQRMYSILCNTELDESAEEESANETQMTNVQREVVYNDKYPCEFFDFIIIDECHRSIYNVWQQVLDYFDAFYIGLTATPDKRTFAFFNQNVVSEYSHEQAVIDGVNVGGEEYIIETDITKNGACITKQNIEHRDRLSFKKRWEQLDEDVQYTGKQLDRDVVNPSQIRTVIREFKRAMETEIFKDRINPETGKFEMPKTLVFAKTDSHADDIINIIREEFAEGNEFCKKITYHAEEDPTSVLKSFRTGYYPRIAVTVDMIATGTDIRPLECLLFMRDVRSKNYFEQMKGRGTRTLKFEDLHQVTPSARENKTQYVLVDAVGVTKTVKTDSRPLERQPSISLKDLMLNAINGDHSEDTLFSLANRLQKLDKILTTEEKENLSILTDGQQLNQIAGKMLNAFNPDVIAEEAKNKKITEEDASKLLAIEACIPINNPKLRDFIVNARKAHDQIIDSINLDTVLQSCWNAEHAANAQKAIESFKTFLEAYKNELDALQIIYNQSYKARPLTLRMVKDVVNKLSQPPYVLTVGRIWGAYSTHTHTLVKEKNIVLQLSDIVSLIKFALGQESELSSFASNVKLRFRSWAFGENRGHEHFTEEQMEWLRMIRDQICISVHISKEDLDDAPFAQKGGLGKFYKVFGADYERILNELNIALIA